MSRKRIAELLLVPLAGGRRYECNGLSESLGSFLDYVVEIMEALIRGTDCVE